MPVVSWLFSDELSPRLQSPSHGPYCRGAGFSDLSVISWGKRKAPQEFGDRERVTLGRLRWAVRGPAALCQGPECPLHLIPVRMQHRARGSPAPGDSVPITPDGAWGARTGWLRIAWAQRLALPHRQCLLASTTSPCREGLNPTSTGLGGGRLWGVLVGGGLLGRRGSRADGESLIPEVSGAGCAPGACRCERVHVLIT